MAVIFTNHNIELYLNQLPLKCEIDVRKYKFHNKMKQTSNSVLRGLYVHSGQGHREFPFRKRKIPPRQRKNSRKFPFGKILHSAHSSTQFSDIYWCNYNDRSVCKTLHGTLTILVFKCLEIRIPLLSPIETDQQRPGKVVSGQNCSPPSHSPKKCKMR